ncbi:hypothetical protein ADEAN_000287900 [Angomonas deanei]|uniref:Uncharacterized protein n=1 Tax=Angomonas deanei TaxID=59799 RepID=A0A7G2C8J5_9TRYP|nr:hypothetical protein ADEAN_000287900 [Angomonas deanei]
MQTFEIFKDTLDHWFHTVHLPIHLQHRLFEKLCSGTLDGGDAFYRARVECDDPDTPETTVLMTSRPIAKHEDIWLVEHAVTFIGRHCLKEDVLHRSPQPDTLCRRLEEMLCIPVEEEGACTRSLEDRLDVVASRLEPLLWSFRVLPVDVRHYPLHYFHTEHSEAQTQYVLHDELGTAAVNGTRTVPSPVQQGNVRLAILPILIERTAMVVSVMWPIKDMERDELVVCPLDAKQGGRLGEPQSGEDLLVVRYSELPSVSVVNGING